MDPELQDRHSDPCLCTNVSNHRGRRLVVAFDGTQNQFGPESSHVVEFYSRIVKSGDQLSYYSSGIGTFVPPSSRARRPRMVIKNKWASMMARHFKSNILSGYRFLSDKYEVGDQIFLLGFSRGAYQARVLAAMIEKVGLLRTGNNEQIPFAFKMYRDLETSKDIPIVSEHSGLRGQKTTAAKEFKKAFCYDVKIHFVGVWDTVSSVGAFRNKYYPGAERADNICFFRHALALDERRVKFLPEYVVAKKEDFLPGESGRPAKCKEVWFRGYHSDVGGGRTENTTSDNGAIPSRWMAYEAMLAGLEMTPFWGGIKVKDLEPNIGRDSMTWVYKLLEYIPIIIKWEVHSECNPRLLTKTNDEEPPQTPPREFSQWHAAHRKRPRQILDHQKLHASVCLHDSSGDPFARLPDSWINQNQSGAQYGWTEIIRLLRDDDRDKAAWAFISKSTIHLPPKYPSIAPADSEKKNVRETVRGYKSKSEASSRRREGSPGHQSLDHQSPKDSASRRSGGMNAQSVVVQNTSPGEGVSTERVPSPLPLSHSSPVSSPASSPVPLPVPFPVPSPTPLPNPSPVAPSVTSSVTSSVTPPVAPPVAPLVASQVASPVYSSNPFTLLAEAIEWDLLDCNAIPTLIAGVLRGTNMNEFLERLQVLAYLDIGKTTIHEGNGNLFTSMIRQVFDNKNYVEHTGPAIQVAYEVFWHSDVDLYDSNTELWKIIHSKVESWNELGKDTPASSLHRAVRLLHKTDSENALVEIKNTIIGMFNQWRQSSTEHRCAPVQLRFLLETAVEFNVRVQDYVLQIAVFSSLHFSDAAFTERLLNCLLYTIRTAGGEMKTLAMLCFCILCAIDENVKLGDELSGALQPKFVEVGVPMEDMWELITSKSPYISRIGELTKLLHRSSNYFKRTDRLWAHYALDEASIFQQAKQLGVVPKPALPYRPYCVGGPSESVGGPSAGGMMMSGSNMFGSPTAGQLVESLPSPWETCSSPPPPPSSSSVEVHIYPPSTSPPVASLHLYEDEGFSLPEHAKSDKGQ